MKKCRSYIREVTEIIIQKFQIEKNNALYELNILMHVCARNYLKSIYIKLYS